MDTATLEQSTPTPAVLTAQDRCDQCGARAWVRVTLATGELRFCAHHAGAHMDRLRDVALEIVDERHLLLAEEGA